MKTLPLLVSAAVLAVGLACGTLAFQAASGGGSSLDNPAAAAPATPVAHRAVRPRPTVRWAPCRPPAARDGAACVTEVVRTVVVPAPPAAAAPAPLPASAPATAPTPTVSAATTAGETTAGESDDGSGDDRGHDDGTDRAQEQEGGDEGD